MRALVFLCIVFLAVAVQLAYSRQTATIPAWSPDNGDGTYTNPVIYADYSDPDAIRVGDDYYMTSSSFSHFPGLPILHSKDLVNWTIIGHAVQRYPFDEFSQPRHGMGIWAPSIRFHNGEFYIYFGDPDRGIFMTKSKNPAGPWEPLRLIHKALGWIDACPLWDDDGNAYLVHAWANSRSGIKSLLAVNRMNREGTEVLGDSVVVFDGHVTHPTIEGPKFYKRNGYYYIFAPAGGVKLGWQSILRSKNIFGPYESRNVLGQGSTNVNGPHQGAWVDTKTGQDWFIHFQDRYAYGRVVHLQPMHWENDWPVIGKGRGGSDIGEPVARHAKPDVGTVYPAASPQTSDEFASTSLGLQWQWEANGSNDWYSLDARSGWLRLYSQPSPVTNLWFAPALLLQKFPAPVFSATTKLDCSSLQAGEHTGLVVFGQDYGYVGVAKSKETFVLSQVVCTNADKGGTEQSNEVTDVGGPDIILRVDVRPENPSEIIPRVLCSFSFSTDGQSFHPLGKPFTAREGMWVGAKVGLFTLRPAEALTHGYIDVDWFRIEKQ